MVQDRGRAYGNLGDCYEALGDFEEAVRCHEQYLAIAQSIDYISGESVLLIQTPSKMNFTKSNA